MTAAVHARWAHRVDGLIHSHAWQVEATVQGPENARIVFPADDLETLLLNAISPWVGHYLTDEDLGEWKGFQPYLLDAEATVEEIARQLWQLLEPVVPGLVEVALVESTEFDRCRTVRLARSPDDAHQQPVGGRTQSSYRSASKQPASAIER
jgi:6-pyruvoyl-tetrahydropterin synthase